MKKLLTTFLFAAVPMVSHAQEWRTYDDQNYMRLEINAQAVRVVDGKVFFEYRTRYKNGAMAHMERAIRAVVDCTTRQRADVERNGTYELRSIYAGTSQDKQANAACAIANGTPIPSSMAAAPAPVPARYSEDDAKLLWEEAAFTSNGMSYQYTLYTMGSKEAIEKCLAEYAQCFIHNPKEGEKFRQHYSELPYWLRDAIGALQPGMYSVPVAKPTGQNWVLVLLDKSEPAAFATGVDPRTWVEKFAPTALPSVTALKTDPELVMRRELNRVRNVDDLRKALSAGKIDKAHLDARLSSGSTLLLKAIGIGDLTLAKELLDQGASPDQCGVAFCPLGSAAMLNRALATRLLLEHKAKPNGSPMTETPLMSASVAGNRDIAQMLLDAGADPLLSKVDALGGMNVKRSVLYYAPSSNPEYADWLAKVVDGALAKAGRYGWSAWIEQDKRRKPIVDGGSIDVKRAPFKIVMKLQTDGTSFRLLASEKTELLDLSKNVLIRRQMTNPFIVGAAAADSKFLGVQDARLKDGTLDFNLTSNELGYQQGADANRGTKRQANGKGGTEDVYTVEEFITDSGAVPVAKFAGKEVAMVAGVLPGLGTSEDFFKPARFRLVFQK